MNFSCTLLPTVAPAIKAREYLYYILSRLSKQWKLTLQINKYFIEKTDQTLAITINLFGNLSNEAMVFSLR